MVNILDTIDRAAAQATPATWTDVTDFSTTKTVAGTGSVVLLLAHVQVESVNTTDRTMDFRFTVDASATGSPIVCAFADANLEASGTQMHWAVTGLSAGTHTFAIQAQDVKASATIDARPRSFQVVEFLAAEATLLIDTSSTATQSSTGSFANLTDLSDTVTPASGSLLIFLFDASPDISAGGDVLAEYRFILDGTQDGPYGYGSIDGSDEGSAVGMMWLETGHAATSQVIAVQHRTVANAVPLDPDRLRTFQVIEYTGGTFDLAADVLLLTPTPGQGAPATYADMTSMTGSITPTDTGTVILWLGSGTIDATGGSDESATVRLRDDSALVGAELITWSDSTTLRYGFGVARFVTGLSGAQTMSLQWEDIAGGPITDDARERAFQIVGLDAAAAAAVYPPFPRRQNTLVRM